MHWKRVFILAFVFCFACSGMSFGEEVSDEFLDRKNAVAFKLGAQMPTSSDFTDQWKIGDSDLTAFLAELSYERKLCRGFGIELPLSISHTSAVYSDSLFFYDWSESDFTHTILSPTIKFYTPIVDRLWIYGGGGADLCYTVANYRYFVSGNLFYNAGRNYWTPGGHLLAGIKWYATTQATPLSFTYDLPVSLNLEYKYTWLSISDADNEEIEKINSTYGTDFSSSDFGIGGHSVTLGLTWYW